MKKVLLSATALAAFTGSAFAADLPSRKAPIVAPVVAPMWTGFYAGMNAGYNVGTNDNVRAIQWGPYGPSFNGSGVIGGLVAGLANGASSSYLGAGLGAAGLAQSGVMSNTQNGFVGGGQIGYNYQYSNFVIGAEADLQGTSIRATSRGAGIGGYGVNSLAPPNVDTLVYGNVAAGGNVVQTGVDWMGTVRGRVGYLWTPTMLMYGTAGVAYGNVYADVASTAQDGNTLSYKNPNLSTDLSGTATRTFVGGGQHNQINVGWTAGGGLEWMFMPNWSLKAEALYWNLGNMNVNTGSYAPNTLGVAYRVTGVPVIGTDSGTVGWGASSTSGRTNVNYQGITARAGVNYHFNLVAAPVVASY